MTGTFWPSPLRRAAGRLRRRAERQHLLVRAIRRRGDLSPVCDRTRGIRDGDILLMATLRDEGARLAYFLDYYRRLGVAHFLIVDNDSTDGGSAFLAAQDDVSLWRTSTSYRDARFGMDWIGWLLLRHGHGHWCLTVDPDEFLVYPHCDSRPLRALTDWLDTNGRRAFPAMLLDLYPQGPVEAAVCQLGENPVEVARWFDPANYAIRLNTTYGNLWIQGGPRARCLFADDPEAAPALNKIPLVKWHWRYSYVSSTHMLLPRALNRVFDADGGEAVSGCLLHPKFLAGLAGKAAEELTRGQHYAGSREYRAYDASSRGGLTLWCDESREYQNWQQLEELGLISKGGWL